MTRGRRGSRSRPGGRAEARRAPRPGAWGAGLGPDLAVGGAVIAVAVAAAARRTRLGTWLARSPWRQWTRSTWFPGLAVALPALVLLAVVLGAAARRRQQVSRVRGASGDGPAGQGWATRRELASLRCRAPTGDRIVLGAAGPRGSLLAAEPRQSVLVVGPSQSGKTTALAVPAILEWDGPVLATSVKTDLLHATRGQRASSGEIAVFDPTGVTGDRSCAWSPLAEATSWGGARRVAHSLCSVGRSPAGIEDAAFWYGAAERLLAPLLRAAALASGSMGDVLRWLDEETANEPLLVLDVAGEREAARVAMSCFSLEERQRSSVYSTARSVLDAYADPAVLASEHGARRVTPDWLLAGEGGAPGGVRTLYCCAPARDQDRLAPVFVALVRSVLDAAFASAARNGRPLDPPLLVVLDEAANVAPLDDLDQVLSTAAGHGISLVTVWQDLAQIEARYDERWATIVNNHRAKAICPGVADPRTLELVSSLIGDVEAPQLSTSRGGEGSWSETESRWRVPVAPAGWIRRMPSRHVLVVYGGLPPALAKMRQVSSRPDGIVSVERR
ncbi:MAG TPA: type IV secretory system conjugative DNA transfer family protein [Acidimicrobiales bacterium]|nr:type IV secretory system conjugative DNA transfer family protein [Acidimicrobiales bacterium]